jgi:hypothetical protein
MALGERRRRSVIAKLVELALALFVLLMPTSALALTRASVGENVSVLTALQAKTRVRAFELAPAKIASGFELSSARNASGKSARGRGEGVRVHHRNRVWSPELAAFLSPDEFEFATTTGTLWSWPRQNPMRWRDPGGQSVPLPAGSADDFNAFAAASAWLIQNAGNEWSIGNYGTSALDAAAGVVTGLAAVLSIPSPIGGAEMALAPGILAERAALHALTKEAIEKGGGSLTRAQAEALTEWARQQGTKGLIHGPHKPPVDFAHRNLSTRMRQRS